MTHKVGDLLGLARAAVAKGCELLSTVGPGEIRAKGDRDFVTDLDRRIQDVMRDFLAEAVDGIGFMGEESEDADIGPTEDYVWALDPIDGTSNFIHGLPLCAISLALVHRGQPIVGVIGAPFLNLEYQAAAGRGAFANDRRICVSDTAILGRAIVSLGDYAVGSGAAQKNERRFAVTAALAEKVERIRMFGSAAIDLAWVAEGRTDACVILSNKPWDTAAGVLIARESGAVVSDSTGNPHSFRSRDTIATTPRIAESLFAAVDR
ncbi:inositol monophosphatase [Nocardia sp. 2YAB30]|uniref:inositol monophosphatase family protein n=1 Tax=unclassified Nocardia TaxID=2637762 RepID=UPI003F96002B